MGKKGGKRSQKRLPAPPFWPIHTKEFRWAVKPRPGPHPKEMCLPLSIVVRDLLHYTKTARETKTVLAEGKIRVDGKARRDEKYPAGLMDVLEVPDAESTLRILPTLGKELSVVKIPKKEASFKLCRIEGKTTVSKGNVQLNLHDGRNILVKVKDPRNPLEDTYSTCDTLQISLPGQKILKHMKFSEGAYGLITAGRNMGRHGKLTKIEAGTAMKPQSVTVEGSDGKVFQTIADHVFVVGEEKPLVKLWEE